MHSFSALAQQFETRFPQAVPEGVSPVSLYDPIRYFLGLGGKRVRPVLCLMAAELFGDIPNDAWHAATAIEVFHNFTLVHDDIMDKAPLRRGQATLHQKYGLTSGILGGDAMCILAYEHLAKISAQLQPVMQVFNRTALEVCEGQQLDMDFETRDDVSVKEYLHMIALKTSVLLAASLKIGALIGGASLQTSNKIYEFGKAVGIAFQLQDDYLDAFGAPEKTGKQPGGDILAGKKTLLFLKAMECADEEKTAKLRALMTNPAGADTVEKVLRLFDETGAKEHCRNAVIRHSEQAFKLLDELTVTGSRKAPLREVAAQLLQREF